MKISRQLAELEKNYTRNGYGEGMENAAVSEGERESSSYALKAGTIPILLSAPHSVAHFRCDSEHPQGRCKPAEMHTGGMAELLGELTGCHVIAALSSLNTDYNYDSAGKCIYKQAVKEYVEAHDVKVVLDLHGANETRNFAVEIGTVNTENRSLKDCDFIAELIQSRVEERCAGFADRNRVTANTLFSASNENTVTNYISRTTEAACVQLEINWMYRNPKEPERVEAMLQALKEVIAEIAERLSQK